MKSKKNSKQSVGRCKMNNSDLNNKYFIDDKAFNCPFCGLRNATYTILAILEHDISTTKKGKIIFVKCNRCGKISVHFAPYDVLTSEWKTGKIGIYMTELGWGVLDISYNISFRNSKNDASLFDVDLDSKIYHSIPSSFFTMDERIPKKMRQLVDEAQECKKANLKTGASACLRKLIYTLLSDQLNKKAGKENVSLKDLGYEHYSDCIKAFKEYCPDLTVFIEPLEDITGITSDQVHENSWDEISSKDIEICLVSIKDLLDELYVQPALLKERREAIFKMKEEALHKQKPLAQQGQKQTIEKKG